VEAITRNNSELYNLCQQYKNYQTVINGMTSEEKITNFAANVIAFINNFAKARQQSSSPTTSAPNDNDFFQRLEEKLANLEKQLAAEAQAERDRINNIYQSIMKNYGNSPTYSPNNSNDSHNDLTDF
jgi:hypothetical protein